MPKSPPAALEEVGVRIQSFLEPVFAGILAGDPFDAHCLPEDPGIPRIDRRTVLTANHASRHKVFISFHEQDIRYKERFVRMMDRRTVDQSVDTGNIDDTGLKTTTVRQKIRDEYIADATVTIVLIGPCTWQRKHVDWEIGSSIRKTRKNPRCGLVGILLPNHPNYGKRRLNHRLIPPRLADNCNGDDPYAVIYNWPKPWTPAQIGGWIHRAFVRRQGASPNNGRRPFGRNWIRRKCSEGWTN